MIKRNEDIVARKIHDTFFLINIKQNYLDDKCTLYEINELGYFIWNALAITDKIEVIVNMINNEIDEPVEKSIIENDVRTFFDVLSVEGYVVRYGND